MSKWYDFPDVLFSNNNQKINKNTDEYMHKVQSSSAGCQEAPSSQGDVRLLQTF